VPENADVCEMCKVLNGLITDPEAREQVALEFEYERIMNAGFNEMGREIAEAKKQIAETKNALAAAQARIAELEILKKNS
jgi:hypothetical protein